MILSYNWQILENLISDETSLEQILEPPKPTSQQILDKLNESPNATLAPISLCQPTFGFILAYIVEQPSEAPEIYLGFELYLFDRKIPFTVLRERRSHQHIYAQLRVEDCEIFDKSLTLSAIIKYNGTPKGCSFTSLTELIQLAGQKELNVYGRNIYTTIKREITIEEPVAVECIYHEDGYVWIKLSRLETNTVDIISVELLNWLTNGSVTLQEEVIESTMTEPITLKSKEAYVLLFFVQSQVNDVEIPLSIIAKMTAKAGTFKMIKMIKMKRA